LDVDCLFVFAVGVVVDIVIDDRLYTLLTELHVRIIPKDGPRLDFREPRLP
jgi:hypothetical protein